MKKILLPIAFFAAVALSACGDDEIEATCDASDKDLVENCDISGAETCVEENGDVHYTYKGKNYSEDELDKLISDMCPNATNMQKAEIRKVLTAQGKRLLDRIRVNAIRAI